MLLEDVLCKPGSRRACATGGVAGGSPRRWNPDRAGRETRSPGAPTEAGFLEGTVSERHGQISTCHY